MIDLWYGRPELQSRTWRRLTCCLLVIASAVAAWSVVHHIKAENRDNTYDMTASYARICAIIGAFERFEIEHHGDYPESLQQMVDSGYLEPGYIRCYSGAPLIYKQGPVGSAGFGVFEVLGEHERPGAWVATRKGIRFASPEEYRLLLNGK